jgi:hypothetical protein
MSPKSLFSIILKIFGFFFLIDLVKVIPELFSLFHYSNMLDSQVEYTDYYKIAEYILLYGILFYLFIFKSNFIIKLFKLDQGFSESEFSFKLSMESILNISLIVISGVLIIRETTQLFLNIHLQFFEPTEFMEIQSRNLPYLVASSVKILIAIILIFQRKTIVRLIIRDKSDKPLDM